MYPNGCPRDVFVLVIVYSLLEYRIIQQIIYFLYIRSDCGFKLSSVVLGSNPGRIRCLSSRLCRQYQYYHPNILTCLARSNSKLIVNELFILFIIYKAFIEWLKHGGSCKRDSPRFTQRGKGDVTMTTDHSLTTCRWPFYLVHLFVIKMRVHCIGWQCVFSHETGAKPMLTQCWSTVGTTGLFISQHRPNTSCLCGITSGVFQIILFKNTWEYWYGRVLKYLNIFHNICLITFIRYSLIAPHDLVCDTTLH